MDNYTLITELVKALAWPLTVLLIFLALRKPLIQLIPTLRKLKYKDLEVDFGNQVREVSEEVRKVLPVPSPSRAQRDFRQHLEKLAPLSPRAVILEGWLELEEAAIGAVKKASLPLTGSEMRQPRLLGKALADAGILDEDMQRIYNQLRNLRNAAAHAVELDIDSETALEYADSAQRLTEFLRSKS